MLFFLTIKRYKICIYIIICYLYNNIIYIILTYIILEYKLQKFVSVLGKELLTQTTH